MRTTRTKSIVVTSGTAALVLAAFAAPGAVAAENVDGDVAISNTETVSVLMSADGEINTERVYEQLVLSGKGSVDVSNPVSTDGLRNLDGFGGWEVVDGAQRVRTDVDGEQKYRSVSSYTGDLPVSIDVEYRLDGERVEPGDVVGEDGELEVRYTVINTTGTQQDVTYTDGEGTTKTAKQAVVIPLVGSMTTVLPSTFRDVRPDGANAAGDGKGGTQLSFTMTLFPPIGSDRASFGYTAEVEDGVVPKASLSLLPVNPLENNSFKGGAASYKGGADKGADLTAGAVTIDENLLKIRDGANDLVDGLIQLRDGSAELNAGLAGKAAPGAGELAAGAGKLDAGAKKLRGGTGDLDEGAGRLGVGADKLDAGLKKASAGGPKLLDGVRELSEGAKRVDDGLVALKEAVTVGVGTPQDAANGVESLRGGAALLAGGFTRTGPQDKPQEWGVLQALGVSSAGLQQVINTVTASLPEGHPLRVGLVDNLTKIKGGVDGVSSAINGRVLPGITKLDDGLAQLDTSVGQAVGTPGSTFTPAGKKTGPSLRNGMGLISGGLSQLSAKGGELSDGLQQLSAGARQLSNGTKDLKSGTGKLNAGAGELSDGTGRLSTGAGTLSSGLQDAAEGSGKLSAGLEKAAGSAPKLPEGAEELSEKGTSQLVNVGNGTAMDFGIKYALIEAGAARAADVQPYGSPEDASSLTAYKFDLAAAEGQGSANGMRGIAIAVLAAGALGLMALRRRALQG